MEYNENFIGNPSGLCATNLSPLSDFLCIEVGYLYREIYVSHGAVHRIFAKGTSSASSVTLISGILGPGQETFRYLEVQEWGVQCPVSVALAARETSGSELANQLHPPWHVAASNWEWRKQMARQGAKAITILLSFLPPSDSPSQPQPLRIRETAQSCLGHKCN